MTLLIDTAVVPAPQRVDFWSQSSSDVYHPVAIRAESDEGFSGRMWGDEIDSLGLFRIITTANTMSRSPKMIAAGDPECLHLKIVLRGRMQAAQEHRSDVLAPGDMTMYDTSQPAIFRADQPLEVVVVRLPKAVLGTHAAKMAALTALRIPGSSGLPRLAAQFFCGVAAGRADGSIAAGDANVAERIIDLVRGVYADRIESRGPERMRSRFGLLLQQNNRAQPLLIVRQRHISFRRNHVRMCRADLLHTGSSSLCREQTHRIGTVQMKGMGSRQLVPKLLQSNRSHLVPLPPQQRDNLAKDSNRPLFSQCRSSHSANQTAHDLFKQRRIRLSIHHELRQGLGHIKRQKTSFPCRLRNIQNIAAQARAECVPVLFGGDHQRGVARSQRRPDKAAQAIDQEGVFLVKLNLVVAAPINPLR